MKTRVGRRGCANDVIELLCMDCSNKIGFEIFTVWTRFENGMNLFAIIFHSSGKIG